MYAVASQYAYSEIWLVEGAGHARSREVAGEQAYKEHVESFLINSGVMAEYEAEAGIEGEAA
jgi:hypothetical protein